MSTFIPVKRANHVLLDPRISEESLESLKKLGVEPILVEKSENLADPVAYHPDMLFHPLGEKTLLHSPDISQDFKELLRSKSFKLIEGETVLEKEYPKNISYNAINIGNIFAHNIEYTDKTLKTKFEDLNYKFINIAQGYSKCSVAIISDRALITSDMGIVKKIKKEDLDILSIESGYIKLEGYSCGFIGGTMGMLDKTTAVFNGSLSHHIDGDRIRAFLLEKNIEIIELNQGELVDIGSLMFFSL